MSTIRVMLAAMSLGFALALVPATLVAEGADTTPPVVTVTTADGTTVEGPGSFSDGAVFGSVRDDMSGVHRVSVWYTRWMEGFIVWGELIGATLDCRSHLECDWSARPPRVPGCYKVQALAADRARNESAFTEPIHVAVTAFGVIVPGTCP